MPRKPKQVEPTLRNFDPKRVGDGTTMVKVDVVCVAAYTDLVEWRRCLWQEGLSPARVWEWLIKQASMRDPEVIRLLERINRETDRSVTKENQGRVSSESLAVTQEDLYEMIESTIEGRRS